MTLTNRAKFGIALMTLLGVCAYLIVVDYGINAGRIHHGVDVRGVNVGGLTWEEAVETLGPHGAELQETPVILTREGFSCNFIPSELGWDPRPEETSTSAYRVGRGVSWLSALGTRVKAWFAGVTIPWTDKIDPAAVGRLIDRCETEGSALGYEIRRWKLRQRIRDAIVMWPRSPVNIPIEARSL